MNNLQNNIKNLRIAVYILITISIFNVVMLFLRPNKPIEQEVLWQESLQVRIQEIQASIDLVEKKIANLKQELPQTTDYTRNIENSMQSSISLILTNIEEKQNKFKNLSKKVADLDEDISTLKKRFSSMKKENP